MSELDQGTAGSSVAAATAPPQSPEQGSLPAKVVPAIGGKPEAKILTQVATATAVLAATAGVFVAGNQVFTGVKSFASTISSALKASSAAAAAEADAKKQQLVKEEAAHQESELRQLRTFGSYADLVAQHRRIAARTVRYVYELEKAGGYYGQDPAKLTALLDKYQTGAMMYYSAEFKEFREIHEFYEDLGLQVTKGALDKELVFELVTFPTDFVKKTKCLGQVIGENWFGKGLRIAGFGDNSVSLMHLYSTMRSENAAKAGRPFKETPDCECPPP